MEEGDEREKGVMKRKRKWVRGGGEKGEEGQDEEKKQKKKEKKRSMLGICQRE